MASFRVIRVDRLNSILVNKFNRMTTMKKKIWMVMAVAGMLLSVPHVDAQAAVKVQIGVGIGRDHNHHHNRGYDQSRRYRDERRRHRDIEYRRHHHHRRSGITIKL